MGSVTTHRKAVEQYFTAVLFAFQVYSVCKFEKYVSILELAVSGAKGLTP